MIIVSRALAIVFLLSFSQPCLADVAKWPPCGPKASGGPTDCPPGHPCQLHPEICEMPAAKTTTVDPNRTLSSVESDIKDLIAQNDRGAFSISAAESSKMKAILAAMYLDVTKLHDKYRTAKGNVDKASLYKEIEATLDKNAAADKSLILSLKKKAISAKGHECENFCWESCGHNSIGEWVCFLSCRRRC